MWTLLLVTAPGCQKNFLNQNDELRARVMELETQVKEMGDRAEAAQKRLEIELKRTGTAHPALPEGVRKPVVSRIEIENASRGIDIDKNGKDDTVRIYLKTYDHRMRFLQAVATASVTVAAVPPGKAAVTLATREFDAKAFDDAYRTGLGGIHYTLEVPLASPPPEGTEKLIVTVSLKDLLTGATHDAEKIIHISNEKPADPPADADKK